MKSCPRCTYPLEVALHREVELEHCRRCGGTFLTPEKGPPVFGPFVDPAVWVGSAIATEQDMARLRCPVDGHPLMRAFDVAYGKQAVEVDLCSECRGIWIDADEGKILREIVMAAGQDEMTGISAPDARTGPVGYVFQLISGFPLEVWNPVHNRPRATVALVGILAAVFGLQFLGPGEWILAHLVLVPAEILSGRQLWTLFTAIFLHGNILHLLGNVYVLFVFGDNVEDYLGGPRFLALFIVAGLTGSLLQTVFQVPRDVPNLGASGAIAGVMAAYVVIFPKVKVYQMVRPFRFRLGVLWFIGFWLLWNLVGALANQPFVGWFAHLGGFAAGAAFAWPFRVRPLAEVFRRVA